MSRCLRQIAAGLLTGVVVICGSCSSEAESDSATQQGTRNDSTTVAGGDAAASDQTSNPNDWPGFRGVDAMGVAKSSELPISWSASENLLWKSPLPGSGASSPVVFGDHIYLTSYTGYLVPGEPDGNLSQLQRQLLCLDRNQGNILWRKDVAAKLPEEERIRDHGYAANTPAADADRVYAFFGKSGVVAYSHLGDEQWRADVGGGTNGWGTAASPVLYQDLVIINASVESESLIALDRSNGKERWRAKGIKESWNTPILVKSPAGDIELVVAIHGKVLGFNPSTGDQLWSCDTDITWYMVPCGVAADGVVYYLGGRSGISSLAVKTGGRGNVTKTHRLWTSKKGSNVSSPVYQDGYLYWMHDSMGIAYCARADTGELVYEKRMDRGDQVYASTLLADGRVYHLGRNGKTFVLAAKPEYELLSTNDLSDRSQFDASPAVTGNRLLIRSGKALYCIGK